MKTHLGFLLAFCSALPVLAQTAPTKEQVLAETRNVQKVLANFEQITDKINFGRWNAPYGLTEARRGSLTTVREEIRAAGLSLADLKRDATISSFALFVVCRAVEQIIEESGNLAKDVDAYEQDGALAQELIGVMEAAAKLNLRLVKLLINQLLAQEAELQACRAKR